MSAWSFEAWRSGIMVRYFVYIMVCFFFVVFSQAIFIKNQFMFGELIALNNKLFEEGINASVLDFRVVFTCSPRTYTYNHADLDILQFYQSLWG